MSADNKNCHMTREDRIIIETGITNGSSKWPLLQLLVRTTLQLARKLISIDLFPIEADTLVTVLTMQNVSLAEDVMAVIPMRNSNATVVTDLQEPATDAVKCSHAVMTSINILLILLKRIMKAP